MQWSKPLLRTLASPIRTSCSPCCYIWPLVQLPANRPREEAEDGPSIRKAHQYLDRVRANGLVNPLLPVTLWSKYKNLNAHTQGRWHSIVVSSPGTWNEVTKPLQYIEHEVHSTATAAHCHSSVQHDYLFLQGKHLAPLQSKLVWWLCLFNLHLRELCTPQVDPLGTSCPRCEQAQARLLADDRQVAQLWLAVPTSRRRLPCTEATAW